MEYNYLCKNLKYLRKINNLTQAEFANKLGLNRSTYANQEKCGIPSKFLSIYSDVILNEFGYSIVFLIKNDLRQQKSTDRNSDNAEIIKALEIIELQLKEIKEKFN